jgi:hypothetical protein
MANGATRLTWTPGSAPTSSTTWTVSFWIKRGLLEDEQWVICAEQGDTGNNFTALYFAANDTLIWREEVSGGDVAALKTNRVFRDPAAWYHIVLKWDTTNGSAGDRMKMFINGVEEGSTGGYSTDTQPSSSIASEWGQQEYQGIGQQMLSGSVAHGFAGSLAHFHYADGTAYDASTFGETDSTSGLWVPNTSPTVAYGTNGFFLKFQDASNFGDDSSGNGNDLTSEGTGVTKTQDTPNNNFCTLNPLNSNHSGALTNGNTTGTTAADAVWRSTFSTMGAASGKWYWEGKCVAEGSWTGIGVASIENMTAASGNSNFAHLSGGFAYQDDGVANNQSSESSYGDTYTTGDIIGVAFDATNGNMWFSKNGTWQNSATISEIAAGTTTNAAFTGMASTTYLPTVKFYNGTTWSMNYGNGYFGTTIVSSSESDDAGIGSFEYDVPGGYYALCTNNLGDQS